MRLRMFANTRLSSSPNIKVCFIVALVSIVAGCSSWMDHGHFHGGGAPQAEERDRYRAEERYSDRFEDEYRDEYRDERRRFEDEYRRDDYRRDGYESEVSAKSRSRTSARNKGGSYGAEERNGFFDFAKGNDKPAGISELNNPAKTILAERIYPGDNIEYFDAKYLISPGDQLEVTYHINTTQLDKYIIAIGDQIRVEFYSYPQFDRTLNVRPDGRVTLPYAGDLMAAGKTPMQVSKDVNKAYAKLLTNPHCTVSLIRYGERIRELKEAIKTAPRGQSRLALVQPDGRVSLPLLPPIMAGGHSLEQVSKVISHEYESIVPGIATSTALQSIQGNNVYVFGAVAKAGFYAMKGPTTVIQAIAMAGGFTPSDQRSNTVLITRDEHHRPVARVLDLKSALQLDNGGLDIFLRQADVVYVPTSFIGRASIIGENLRRMIPFDFGVFYNMGDTVDFVN